MKLPSLTQRVAFGLVAASLCAAPTFAAAAPAPSVSPFVALSYLGSDSSRAALCGAAGSAAAANAAAVTAGTAAAATTTAGQPAPAPGCVLPMVDPVVAAPVEAAVVPAQGASLLGPLIAGLAGLVAVLVLANALDGDDEEPAPISPT